MDSHRNEMIKLLFANGCKQREICSILCASGFKISERHLRRLIKTLGLRRRSYDRPLDEICQAIMSELKHWSPWQGIRAMHKRVRGVGGIQPCYRNDVGVIMGELDASGLIRRCPGKKKIERRNYFSRGPNYTWHIDGNDKLKFFGIWVHLGIDGFSRKILWLMVGTSNRQQSFIARYFYDAVWEHNGCPRFIRADRGKENLIVGQMQVAFHFRQASDHGRDSFRVGKSVHNQACNRCCLITA
nr:uncharacterized protein LOC129415450 isoform X1 [Misgurnus anguillicaudatus]